MWNSFLFVVASTEDINCCKNYIQNGTFKPALAGFACGNMLLAAVSISILYSLQKIGQASCICSQFSQILIWNFNAAVCKK